MILNNKKYRVQYTTVRLDYKGREWMRWDKAICSGGKKNVKQMVENFLALQDYKDFKVDDPIEF